MGDLGGLEDARDSEEPRECFAMRRGQADPTSKNSSAVPGQHQHEKICIWTVFAVIFDCFGMRSDAAADHEKYREESTTGNLNALLPEHQHAQHKQLTNLSESPSIEECATGKLIAGSAGHEHEQEEHFTNMYDLPKKCIKAILSFTTPRDVCRLAAVSTLFRSAANSNAVWNKFIPPQCYQILPTAVTFGLITSKRDLYFRLCESVLIDGGRKRFWLERSTAKIGYMLSARELYIPSGDNQRCCRWISRNDSRFKETAELLSICWLDVGGRMDCGLLSPDTLYRAVFVLKFGGGCHGWDGPPIKFSVKTPGTKEMEFDNLLPVERQRLDTDGWTEVVAGEFAVRAEEDIDEDSSRIEFRIKEVESNRWKGGLLIDGLKIEPASSSSSSGKAALGAGGADCGGLYTGNSNGMSSAAVLRAKPTQPGRIQAEYNSSIRKRSNATADDESSEQSITMGDGHKHEQEDHLRNLLELPKKCIEVILSFTTPRDVCRLAAVSTRFRSAANSDSVWNKFIPPQCYQILPNDVNFGPSSSKRELYFRLCDSILIEEGRKRFWLDRSTAKIGYMLSARELYIIWSNNQRYWRWSSRKDSSFEEIAELLSVCWLDVGGRMDCRLLSPDTAYRVVFVLKFGGRSYGWDARPIKFSVKTPGKEEMEFEHHLPVERPGINSDRWMGVVAGEFKVRAAGDNGDDSSHIGFRMKEVESNQWKAGLFIDGVKIEPASAPLQYASFGLRSAAVLRAEPTQPRRIQVQYNRSFSISSDATADDSSEESTMRVRHEHEHEEHLRNLSELPNKCIKVILSFTTPRDVCRLAAVSTRFRSAANSNYVWSKFIPRQCYQILPATAVPLNPFRSKRELYFHLCDPILIDERRKEFWLERSTGKIGYMVSAKEFHIIHMDDPRYWRWVSRDDSSFDEVAMLVQVCWLDFWGAMDCRLLSSDTDYRLVFMLKFREDSIGWKGQSVRISVKTPEGEEISSEQLLVQNKGVANDGWTEVVAAEFTVRAAEYIQDGEKFSVSFRMRDTTNWWKSGLLLNGVKIEPCKSSQ